MIQELILDPSLEDLITDCETRCERYCCGVRAFDFSPLNFAYYLYRRPNFSLNVIVAELRQLMTIANAYKNEVEIVCSVPFLNQSFTKPGLKAFIIELQENLILSLKLSSLSESQRFKP